MKELFMNYGTIIAISAAAGAYCMALIGVIALYVEEHFDKAKVE